MNDDDSLIRGYDLPSEAECYWCGELMILVNDLYYVHASTKVTFCPKANQEE